MAYERQSELVKALEKDESRRVALLEKTRDLTRAHQGYYRIGSGRFETIVSSQEIEDANKRRSDPSLYHGHDGYGFARRGSDPSISVAATLFNAQPDLKEGLQVVGGGMAFVSPNSSRPETEAEKGRQSSYGAGVIERQKREDQLKLSGIAAETNATIRLMELRGEHGEEIETAQKVAALRRASLTAEYQISGDIVKYRESSLQNELDLRLKIAEVQKQQKDSIEREADSLFKTLFTKPADFGKQFVDTIKNAALKPVTEGLSRMVGDMLHPLIYGQDGKGGIAGTLGGMFGGGKQDPIKISTDMNTAVTAQNSATVAALTAAMASAMGMAAPSMPSIGSFGGGASGGGGGFAASIPSIVGGAGGSSGGGGFASSIPSIFGGTGGGFGSGNPASMIGPGGTPGFAGGGSSGGGGLSGILGNLKGFGGNLGKMIGYKGSGQWDTGKDASGAMTEGQGLSGALQGIGKSDFALMAGIGLAMDGLKRGGVGGMLETGGGGALIGYKFGGPLGAAIGLWAGLAAGAIRMLIESKEDEAKKLVQKMYGIKIDTPMAKQIADLARQKYGGHVSIAVRDPDVRKMLELYAAGTGQKMPQSNTTPHAASLSEQGGKLYQDPGYQFGNAYSFQSSIPVAGGLPTSQWPSPGGGSPGGISLRLDGPATTALLSGQITQTVSPEYVSDQFGNAQRSSVGRLQNSAMVLQPGLIVS